MPHKKKADVKRDDDSAKKAGELAGYVEHLQRLQAEFENYKKRVLREREDYTKYANEKLITRLLDVLDDFDRAVDAAEKTRDFDALSEGLKLTSRKIHSILSSEGVSELKAVGEPFNPEKHEALLVEHSDEHPEGAVIEELSRGYMLHSKVIRPSKVKVCRKVN